MMKVYHDKPILPQTSGSTGRFTLKGSLEGLEEVRHCSGGAHDGV